MICPKCGNEFTSTTKWNYTKKYCSRKCGNSHTVTSEQKQKTSATLRKTGASNQFGKHKPRSADIRKVLQNLLPSGPVTRVYKCVCKYSGKIFYAKTPKRIYPDLARNKAEYTFSCQFRFGISSYPKWFTNATKLINEHGWYSTPGSRNGTTNINGISRDHLYSITDGWLNNVPPAIIRHPANCSLVTHKENQAKHKRSKITLVELYDRIDKFNAMATVEGLEPPV